MTMQENLPRMGAVKVTQADRDAVTAFHKGQVARILAGDRTLGENRDAIEQAFALHRLSATPSPDAIRWVISDSDAAFAVKIRSGDGFLLFDSVATYARWADADAQRTGASDAEATREACARRIEAYRDKLGTETILQRGDRATATFLAAAIRALPLPDRADADALTQRGAK